MYNILENINIFPDKSDTDKLNRFVKIITDYNSKVNLVSNNDIKYIFEKHIFDSLALNLFIKKYLNSYNLKLLDVGTGGGFPSSPLSLLFNNIDVCAVDSIRKKIDFINFVKSELGIFNITPICSRIEEINPIYKNSFNVVTSRALAELRIILEYSLPFLKVGGYFVAYKSIKADAEINESQKALKILNAEIVDKIEYTLPLQTCVSRCLIIVQKKDDTPIQFPRKNGLIKKNPL